MTICDKFVSLYTEYLDGSLPVKVKSEFDQHLRTCQKCAESLHQMRALNRQLKALTPVKTSDIFLILLRSRIRQELEKETFLEKVINNFRIYRWPAFATGLTAIILVTLFSYSTIFSPAANKQPITQSVDAVENQITSLESATVTQFPDLYLVVEQIDEEQIFKRGEKINSKTFQQYKMRKAIIDSSAGVYQSTPVALYFTTPISSAAF